MAIANPDKLNVAICDALGLDATRTKSVTITMGVGQPVIVEVVEFVTVEGGQQLTETLKRYTLTAPE